MSKKPNLVVLWAVYGAEQGSADVTSDVQKKMDALIERGEAPVLEVNNTTFEDPAKGHGKHFAIHYNYNGYNVSRACKEGQTLDLSHTNPVYIHGAAYGAKEGSYDVTNEVQGLVNHRGITQFKPKDIFEDPARGHGKHFGIVYSVNGTRKVLACKDDQTVVLK